VAGPHSYYEVAAAEPTPRCGALRGEGAGIVAGSAGSCSCLVGAVAELGAEFGAAGGQVLMDAGGLLLDGGERFHRGEGPPAGCHRAAGELDGVGKPGGQAPFAFCGQPVDFCLLPLTVSLAPPEPGFLAVEPLPFQRQQFSRSLDDFQGAHLEVLNRQAQCPAALVEFVLALVGGLLALGLRGLALIGFSLALVGQGLAEIGPALPFISPAIAVIGHAFPLVSQAFPLVSQAFPLVSRACSRASSLSA
jgi:hypothetical protein